MLIYGNAAGLYLWHFDISTRECFIMMWRCQRLIKAMEQHAEKQPLFDCIRCEEANLDLYEDTCVTWLSETARCYVIAPPTELFQRAGYSSDEGTKQLFDHIWTYAAFELLIKWISFTDQKEADHSLLLEMLECPLISFNLSDE